jgi:two-component system cell cycle sensor histidine kinase/response regulator CckA
MRDQGKTKEQLISELAEHRRYILELEAKQAKLKKAEQTLIENEEKYRTLVEDALIGIMQVDTRGRITYVNNTILHGTGYAIEDMIGKSAFKSGLVPTGYLKLLRKRLSEKLMGEPPSPLEVQFKRKDGQWIWLKIAGKVIWKHGLPAGVEIIGDDITERKQIEEALRQSEERYRTILKTALDGFTIDDLKGRILEVNDSYCEMAGYTREELLSMSISDLEAVEKPEETAQHSKKIMEQGYDHFQTKHKRKDGKIIDLEISANYIDVEEGQIFVSVRDITERKQAEEALRENRDYLERLTDSMVDIVFSVKLPEWIIEWVNNSIELTGYSKDECIGRTIDFLYRDKHGFLDFGKKVDEAIAANSDMIRIEQTLKKKNGELFHAEITTTFYKEKGQVVRILSIIRDITESRRLEEEQAKVAKLESTGTLAGGIAHDFNNILTGIMGNIGLAKRNLQDGDYIKASSRLEDAERASLRAKDLTTQLLTFSRGGLPVKKVTSVAGLLKDSATLALRGSNVRLEFTLPDDLYPVEVDEGQINQVISNLVINADQAMPEGGIINITAANTTIKKKGPVPLTKGNYVRIAIQDYGTGIPLEYQPKIFDPYFTTKQKGSGLGLSVAYSIVKNHGGYIDVNSETGSGTTFQIYLPASGKPAPVEKEISEKARISGKGRILVMDDEEIIRKLLYSALTTAGYEVVLTSDGADTVEEYIRAKKTGRPFDVVILDITIPGGMGGKEAVKKLLDIDHDARVIVSSGYATDPIMSNFKEYGFSAVVPKPFDIIELERTIRNVSSL